MSRQEFKARSKVTSKMTKDGLVERDAATGEVARASKREIDFDLRASKPRHEKISRGDAVNRETKRRQTYHGHDSPEPDIAYESDNAEETQYTSHNNQHADSFDKSDYNAGLAENYSADIGSDGNIEKHSETQLSQPPSEGKQPSFRHTRSRPTLASDDTTAEPIPTSKAGKPPKLKFSDEENAATTDKNLLRAEQQMEKVEGKLEKAHDILPTKRKLKITDVVDEESGESKRKLRFEKTPVSRTQRLKGLLLLRPVKIAANAAIAKFHKEMFQAEQENVSVKAGHRAEMLAETGLRSALRSRKTAPYRKIAKLENAARKKSINLSYRRALADNPKLSSNVFSRMMQKRKIKKQYAKIARESRRAATRARRAGTLISRAGRAVAAVIRRNPKFWIILLIAGLILILLMSCFSAATTLGTGGLQGIMIGSYLAEDEDIDSVTLAFTEWETDLNLYIIATEENYPGYDEYIYHIGEISHNPLELMAYLTARYHYFIFDDVLGDLQSIFSQQYTLSHTPSVEIRYYEVEIENEDGEVETVQVPYEWHILTVTLVAQPQTSILLPHLTEDELLHYSILMESRGARQLVGNPFASDWIGFATSFYGYRVHPVSGEKNLHLGIDIAASPGTQILAALDGIVTFAGNSGAYGNLVIIAHENGIETKYAHCQTIFVSAGQHVVTGDVIATVGSTGNTTGPHLHFEVLRNGRHLNPLIYADIGSLDSERDYGNAGLPMGDGTLEALIAEAMSHLGKPYVYGASGPNSFDCSGFVSFVLNQSGVRSFGRTNVRGLYAMTNPVSQSDARPGDLVFFHSTYSTPSPVTHVGIYLGNGQMIHAGRPVNITSIHTPYWQRHFFGFGRLS